ncbi:hypothetical protein FKW77_005980 [Venturia effusa]|uniref:C2H2-type domain-containing protein n=1 Tax=Venturia effusa TaxID=50376 RepID=A0A517LKJ0_9PEZI|nr:hypothetical protein FKW77_005980 [Venturia effusa]
MSVSPGLEFDMILKKFKTKLSAKELEDFKETTLTDVQNTIVRIQKDQEQLKRAINLTRLRPFLEAFDHFGKTIEIFLNASPLVAAVWGPMKFMLMAASNYTEDFDILLEAYEDIGDHIPFLQTYKNLFQDPDEAMKRVLALIYADIIEFHSKAIRYFSGKVWPRVFRALWRDFKTRFEQILRSLGRHKELIRQQAEIMSMQLQKADSQRLSASINMQMETGDKLRELLRVYLEDRERTLNEAKHQATLEREKKHTDLIEWFSTPPGSFSDQDGFSEVRQQSGVDGSWVLKDEKVRNWIETDPPTCSLLWMNGKPGAGKTVLASVIVEQCLKHPTYKTAWFYCKESDPMRNSRTGVFRGLLGQLLCHCQDLLPYCHEKRINSIEPTLFSPSLIEQLLKLFLEKIPHVFLVIDGIDECETLERKAILTFLTNMVEISDASSPGKLRILFVSQEYKDIERFLRAASIVALTSDHNRSDIEEYVRHKADVLESDRDLCSSQTEEICKTVNARADGMFLYAKLVMENLLAQATLRDLNHEVDEYFPRGLEDAFERILERIKKTHPKTWTLINKLLGWMICVKRPLRWNEIQALVSIDLAKSEIQFDDKKLRSSLQDLCGSLITVLPDGRGLELVHNTAKLYLARSGFVQIEAAECELTTLCLRYLVFPCFERDLDEDTVRSHMDSGQFAFQDYACAKWFHHLRTVVTNGYDTVLNSTVFEELSDALEDFINEFDLAQDSIDDAARRTCSKFERAPFYDYLVYVCNHLLQHEGKGAAEKNKVSIAELGIALARSRKMIEGTGPGPDDLSEFYGDKRYKCPKLTCFYFHEGFDNESTRNQHINRHDRPFVCTAAVCNVQEFGFTSNKDLEKHMKLYHPNTEQLADTFQTAMKPSGPRNLTCDHCPKTFTRGFHKRNHMRTHFGERPFACEECGKAFTRANDCKRHEKIHARR